MALNLPTFYKRTGSAIVFAIVMLAGLLYTSWSYFLLIVLINGLCFRDFIRLIKKITPDFYWPVWLQPAFIGLSTIVLAVVFLFQTGIADPKLITGIALVLTGLFAAGLLANKSYFQTVAQGFAGLIYITWPMIMLLAMKNTHNYLPIMLILMIWANDTLAYLVGSFIGKTPFSPISPKKTWEGTAGGALLTIAGAITCGYFMHIFELTDWIAIALCATVFGTIGDLLESKIKRIAGVKDSGNLMPGHGGAMDRFDSLLLAAPFAGVYVLYFIHISK